MSLFSRQPKFTANGKAQEAKVATTDDKHTLVSAVQYKLRVDKESLIRDLTRIQTGATEQLTKYWKRWSWDLRAVPGVQTIFYQNVVTIKIDVGRPPWLHHNGEAPHRVITNGYSSSTLGTIRSWSKNTQVWENCDWQNALRECHQAHTNRIVHTDSIRPQKNETPQVSFNRSKRNAVTIQKSYPKPRMSKGVESLGKAPVISTLEDISGYWKKEIDQADKDKTAFKSHNGLYRL